MIDNYKSFIKKGEELFIEFDKRETHLYQPDSIIDIDRTNKLIDSLTILKNKAPILSDPTNLDELKVVELKRLIEGTISVLMEETTSTITEPNKVLEIYNVTEEDINLLKDWLLSNREKIIEVNRNQYEYHSKIKKARIPYGNREIREKTEKILSEKLENLKQVLLTLKDTNLDFGEMFKKYIIGISSNHERSFASRVGGFAVISIPNVTYMNQGNVGIEMHELISLFGHEVMGHAFHYFYTESSKLPFYLRWGPLTLASSTRESLANYFQNEIFEYLRESDDSSKLFSSDESFDSVYKLYQDNYILQQYSEKIINVGYWALSQSKMDDFKQQAEEISKYSIEPKWPMIFINRHRNDWSKATGYLLPKIVAELRYSVDVINKYFKPLSLDKRRLYEAKILEGMWTPKGMEQLIKLQVGNEI